MDVLINHYCMKNKTSFSSKKISAKKPIKPKTNVFETRKEKNTNQIFENQRIKQNLQTFYDKEAKKYAETRKKFWHEENIILNEITPLFEK